MKRCTRCGIEKPLSEFSMRSGRENQPRSHCKKCASEFSIASQRRKLEEDPNGYREYRRNLKRRNTYEKEFGFTHADFHELGEFQNWKCYICETDISSKPYLDHDHETNVVRKILCFHCNVGLGHFKDSIVLLERAADYLKEHYV